MNRAYTLAAMQPFVWGSDAPDCTEAIWGRNGYGATANYVPTTCYAADHFLPNLDGPEPPGHGAWDALALPGGTFLDLVGNLSEWSRDDYQLRTEPCWSAPGVMTDPVCTQASASVGLEGSYRGGAWDLGGVALEAPNVADDEVGAQIADVGFRCMKAGE
jgi:formylglycine-generating enzyme required for sulfatase activity